MKVSINWLKELVDLKGSVDDLVKILPLRSISTKEVTENFIELDMKGYNRADLLSMRGVAQEVAAITDSMVLFKDPEEAEFVWNIQKLPSVKVAVDDEKLCPLYCVAKIKGLKVESSPDDWVKKLEDSGIRSINNIADITNLIMLEYGQTIHAFDGAKVTDETMIVRLARKGEKLETLDGKIRNLTEEDLLIADPKGILSLSGIMGGKDSEITENTNTILLEVAIFDPTSIRGSSQRFGLQSEASKRIQHGLTKKRLLQALNAAIKMYEGLGGKLVAVTIVGDLEDEIKKITLTKTKLEELVGIKFEDKQVEDYLKRLYFKVKEVEGGWEVEVPYFRLDLNIEEDVIEEVARMYGYEKIPAEPVSQSKPLQKEDQIFKIISDLRGKLVDLGLTEVQTYSFYSTKVIEALGWNNEKEKLVKIANPISTETEYLRQSIWPNLLEVTGRNMRKGFKDIAIFEIGKAFNVGPDGNPVEDYRLSIALMNGSDNPIAELFSLANSLKIARTIQLFENHALFHPTRITNNMAEIHLKVLNKLGIEKRVAVLEIEL